MTTPYALLNEFTAFIEAREQLRQRREKKKWPWTTDPILGEYRFCNVNRQNDRMTRLLQDWLYRGKHPLNAIEFNAVPMRLFNQAHTMQAIGWLDPMKEGWQKQIKAGVAKVAAKGLTPFNPAYIVSTNGVAMDKVDYLIERVIGNVAARWRTHPKPGALCYDWAEWYMESDGLGNFIANQIVTDLKYGPLNRSADWTSFILAGPGTIRGLNRMLGVDKGMSIPQAMAKKHLHDIREAVRGMKLKYVDVGCFLDLNNLSNCFCEFDKYMRAKTGDGTPKQRYEAVEEV